MKGITASRRLSYKMRTWDAEYGFSEADLGANLETPFSGWISGAPL